jgi:hypothetical protein
MQSNRLSNPPARTGDQGCFSSKMILVHMFFLQLITCILTRCKSIYQQAFLLFTARLDMRDIQYVYQATPSCEISTDNQL